MKLGEPKLSQINMNAKTVQQLIELLKNLKESERIMYFILGGFIVTSIYANVWAILIYCPFALFLRFYKRNA